MKAMAPSSSAQPPRAAEVIDADGREILEGFEQHMLQPDDVMGELAEKAPPILIRKITRGAGYPSTTYAMCKNEAKTFTKSTPGHLRGGNS